MTLPEIIASIPKVILGIAAIATEAFQVVAVLWILLHLKGVYRWLEPTLDKIRELQKKKY